MRRLMLIAGVSAFLGACSSGGCNAGDGKAPAPAKEAPSVGGGGSRGGTSETVSFQGMGKNAPLPAKPGQAPAAPGTNAAAGALGGSAAAEPLQAVICGGFPNLRADCLTDPAYADLKKKCCPTGTIERCSAIPGGARLVGRACGAAPLKTSPAR